MHTQCCHVSRLRQPTYFLTHSTCFDLLEGCRIARDLFAFGFAILFPESIILQETGEKAEIQSEQCDKAIADYMQCTLMNP